MSSKRFPDGVTFFVQVNRLYSERYGHANRKIPSHMVRLEKELQGSIWDATVILLFHE